MPTHLRSACGVSVFDSLVERGDWYGYSLALGSADISLLALANAYRTLANGGHWTPLRTSFDVAPASPPRQVLSPQASFLVGDILADRTARAGTFGLASGSPHLTGQRPRLVPARICVHWCVGYSRRFTVAVWVGNASGAAMHEVSGVSGAAPVWREIMDELHRGKLRSEPPTRTCWRCRAIALLRRQSDPPRCEWFIAGTERKLVRSATVSALAHVAYPADGTVIALDADIPPARQRLALQLSAAAGMVLGTGASTANLWGVPTGRRHGCRAPAAIAWCWPMRGGTRTRRCSFARCGRCRKSSYR